MEQVQTGVDEFMQLVREKKKITLQDAAKQLNLPEKTIQAWTDFLVEEKVLGIEYKFTTPYVYVHDHKKLEVTQEQESYTLDNFKKGFYHKAEQNEIPQEKIPGMWQKHLAYIVEIKKEYFIQEAQKRGIENPQELYDDYCRELKL